MWGAVAVLDALADDRAADDHTRGERCIGWLKECHRVAIRYEKLAVHFLGMIKPAMIQRCLRLPDPSNRAWRRSAFTSPAIART